MVQALIRIDEKTNRILNVVKVKYGLRTKGEAVEKIVEEYEAELLEPEFKPEFVKRILDARSRPSVRVKDIRKLVGLK